MTFWRMDIVIWFVGKGQKSCFRGGEKRTLETQQSKNVRTQGSVKQRERKNHGKNNISGISEQVVNW